MAKCLITCTAKSNIACHFGSYQCTTRLHSVILHQNKIVYTCMKMLGWRRKITRRITITWWRRDSVTLSTLLTNCEFKSHGALVDSPDKGPVMRKVFPWRHMIIYQVCTEVSGKFMMTSSKRNIFRVTGPLWGEFTGHRWIPLTKASDAELWCILWSSPEQMVE